MNDFQEVQCEISKTRLNRNYLTIKFRNSECFQEFVRSLHFRQNEIYKQFREFELPEESFQVTYDYNTIYNMKNEIHNKLKLKKRPVELDNQFSQFNVNAERNQDPFIGENPIAEQKIDLQYKEENVEDIAQKEQEKTRSSYQKEFELYTSTEAIEEDKSNFNFLPKNVKNLIFYDILIRKVQEEEMLGEEMNLNIIQIKIYDIIKQNLLGNEELIQMLADENHLKSFL